MCLLKTRLDKFGSRISEQVLAACFCDASNQETVLLSEILQATLDECGGKLVVEANCCPDCAIGKRYQAVSIRLTKLADVHIF